MINTTNNAKAAQALSAARETSAPQRKSKQNIVSAMAARFPGADFSGVDTSKNLAGQFARAITAQKAAQRVGTAQEAANAQAQARIRTAAQAAQSTAGTSSSSSSSSSGKTSTAASVNGKATYNRNYEVSKAGASYVNKNSPFSGYKITSYTGARNTGIAGASSNHAGVDRAVPEGTKISLPIGTTFYKSGSDSARGNWVELKDANGNILHYQHLQSVASGYKTGDRIKAGTAFATSGHTGVGTSHLHEEYYTPDGGTNITESYWNKYAPKA